MKRTLFILLLLLVGCETPTAPTNSMTNEMQSTTITFHIAEASYISLHIYDTYENLVETLIDDEYYNPGNYNITLDVSNYVSGVYFIELVAGEHSISRKITIIK